MVLSCGGDSNSTEISNNEKVIALESSLQDSIVKFKDLVLDFEHLHTDSEYYKQELMSAKEKCENKACKGAEELKKIIATKEQIIQSVVSLLTKLNDTKNFNILIDAFKILFEEVPVSPLTPPTDENQDPICTSVKNSKSSQFNKKISADDVHKENTFSPIDKVCSIEEANVSITEDVSFKEESLCEIEGTPTGRKSPIIPSKKTKNAVKSTDFRDKKKCPDDWHSPQPKAVKLIFPSNPLTTGTKPKGTGRLRQSRISLVKLKQTNVVDLTCSPELMDKMNANIVQPLIKKESVENDDTILPSPTSGPTNFTLFKSISKASPSKFKKPQLSLKSKSEVKCEVKNEENTRVNAGAADNDMDESINILNQFNNRLRNGIKKENKTPVKMELDLAVDEDATHCDTLIGASPLQALYMQCSPAKRPLGENVNIMNTPPRDGDSSASILPPGDQAAVEGVKRKIPELVEPLYQEPAARSKAEKRNLQGWSCEECKNFYGTLYKNDPVMLAKKIQECSKHRGRHNPARPKTPPNFWNPRWHVPDDTEELNRMNNAT